MQVYSVTLKGFAALALPFMLLFVAPVSFYFGNRDQIEFTLTEVLGPVVILLGLLSALIFAIAELLERKTRVGELFVGVLLGLALSGWVQSQLLVWDLGPLDGRGIDWDKWHTHMWGENFAWLFLTCLVAIVVVKEKRGTRITRALLQSIFLVGWLSIIGAYFLAPEPNRQSQDAQEIADAFSFHLERNTILILLDTFQSDYFDYILQKYPKEAEFLEGFTYYDNVATGYPTTRPSIPYLLSGEAYRNLESFKEYERRIYSKKDMRKQYAEAKYDVQTFGSPIPHSISMESVLEAFGRRNVPTWSLFLDYGLFRAAPLNMKGAVYNDGSWLLSHALSGSYPPGRHGTDIRFIELLEERAEIRSEKKGSFKLFHFFIPHLPLIVNEYSHYDDNLRNSEGYSKQTRGALKVAGRVVEKVRDLGIYDNSEIVILSDHGTLSFPILDKNAKPIANTSTEVPDKVQSSSLALLLVKPPGAEGKLKRVSVPVTLGDLGCLLQQTADIFECREYQRALNRGTRRRRFYYYDWRNAYWGQSYMPRMIEYFIEGHVRQPKSWRRGDYIYEEERKVELRPFGRYVLGTTLSFAAGKDSSDYVLGGWSKEEPNHRWTDGQEARMRFVIDGEIRRNLILKLRGRGYLAKGKIQHQSVDVFVNGKQTATWKVRGDHWYTASIPASVVRDGVIDLTFKINNAAAPCDFSYSTDCRHLGISARKLVIGYSESS